MTDATKKEVFQSLLCCHADLCRMEGRTKDREHDIVASVARAVSRAILDLAAPEEEPKSVEEMVENGERLVWSWYDCPSRSAFHKEAGRACEKEDCCTCKFRPKDTVPVCDWHPKAIKMGKDGEIEWCWCQKCYELAAVVHNPFGDGENWSYCKKCGVSFRLKCAEEGEK